MNLQQFVDIAERESLVDIMLVLEINEVDGLTKFNQADRGPICLLFESGSVMLEQPLGREEISLAHVDLNTYVSDRGRAAEEWQFGVFSVLELFLYPFDEYSPPARIDRICVRRESDDKECLNGMLLTFSTGGTMGVDTTSVSGLRYFLDGQKALFERDRATVMRLKEELVWQRADE